VLVNAGNMNDLTKGFNTSFNKGLRNATSHYEKVAMRVPSSTREMQYAWLGAMPGIREWIGGRIIHNLSTSKYVVENRKFESTVSVERTVIEDDQYGIFGPIFEKMGADTARHPDELTFGLLESGFDTACFDGQYFFDSDHPVVQDGGAEISVSNFQDGAGTPWFLLDCSQPIKPLVYQSRTEFEFTQITSAHDENVFMNDEFTYGVRGRSNAGFGLWQLAYASKADLNGANYKAARAAMQSLKSDSGKPLGITPTHLVIPPTLEEMALTLLSADTLGGGESNIWRNSAELIMTPFLD